jgi:hypothetical protein
MLDDLLAAALADWGLTDCPRTRLSGDVSPRQYHRLRLGPGRSAVAMVTPTERAAQLADWLAVRAWLAGHGVPVPAVWRHHPASGVLLIEDVGDVLLTEVRPPAAEEWYQRTLAHLARLEAAAADEPADRSPAHARRLEPERIRWELRRFRKVVAAPVAPLDDDELALWKLGEDRLTAALTGAPQVWMHRDLHARNLLVHDGAAVWIDFQDAMRGPWLYDVASLLLDPYAALSAERRARLLECYLALAPPRADAAELWPVVASQRLLHCVACYVWVADHVGNPAYLRYLPYALEQLRAALESCPAAEPLARVLAGRWAGMARRPREGVVSGG